MCEHTPTLRAELEQALAPHQALAQPAPETAEPLAAGAPE